MATSVKKKLALFATASQLLPAERCRPAQSDTAQRLHFTPLVKQATLKSRWLRSNCSLQKNGAAGQRERMRDLFDTFHRGYNCISCFPVVSFQRNAKAIPIKPRVTMFFSTVSHSPLTVRCVHTHTHTHSQKYLCFNLFGTHTGQ